MVSSEKPHGWIEKIKTRHVIAAMAKAGYWVRTARESLLMKRRRRITKIDRYIWETGWGPGFINALPIRDVIAAVRSHRPDFTAMDAMALWSDEIYEDEHRPKFYAHRYSSVGDVFYRVEIGCSSELHGIVMQLEWNSGWAEKTGPVQEAPLWALALLDLARQEARV